MKQPIDVNAISIHQAPTGSYSTNLAGIKDNRRWLCAWICPGCGKDSCRERAATEAEAKTLAVEIASDARCCYCRRAVELVIEAKQLDRAQLKAVTGR